MDKGNRFEYDVQRRAQAGTRATLRALVAGYLVYLAWQIVKGVRTGTSSMAPGIAYLAGGFFTLAAVAVGIYAFRRWRADVEAARLPAAKSADSEDSGSSGDSDGSSEAEKPDSSEIQ